MITGTVYSQAQSYDMFTTDHDMFHDVFVY
jgi:hypothetical protein